MASTSPISDSNLNLQNAAMQLPPPAHATSAHLEDLPLDVILEICGNLLPTDLLTLARTTKRLRSTLFSQSLSITAWKQAFLNLKPPVKGVPDGWSHPKAANLMLHYRCDECGNTNVTDLKTFWEDGVRLCRDICFFKRYKKFDMSTIDIQVIPRLRSIVFFEIRVIKDLITGTSLYCLDMDMACKHRDALIDLKEDIDASEEYVKMHSKRLEDLRKFRISVSLWEWDYRRSRTRLEAVTTL